MNPDNLADPANAKIIYDLNGCLFFFSISVFISSSFTVLLTFPAERGVFLRESSANMYSVTSYFFGRSSIELPFCLFFPVVLSAISYYIIGFNGHDASKLFIFSIKNLLFFIINNLVLTLILISIAGNAVGILVGSIFEDSKVSTNVIPVRYFISFQYDEKGVIFPLDGFLWVLCKQ